MKLSKAIEIDERLVKHADSVIISEEVDAIKLGIEALKFVVKVRGQPHYLHTGLLPGETEE